MTRAETPRAESLRNGEAVARRRRLVSTQWVSSVASHCSIAARSSAVQYRVQPVVRERHRLHPAGAFRHQLVAVGELHVGVPIEKSANGPARVTEKGLSPSVSALEQHACGECLAFELQIALVPRPGAALGDFGGEAIERAPPDARRLPCETVVFAGRKQQPGPRIDVIDEGGTLPLGEATRCQRQHDRSRTDTPPPACHMPTEIAQPVPFDSAAQPEKMPHPTLVLQAAHWSHGSARVLGSR